MDSKKFFMKIREIIREEIQYALETKTKNETKISQKNAIDHGIKLVNKVNENSKIKQKPKSQNFSSINDLLEETRRSLQESYDMEDEYRFDSGMAENFGSTRTGNAIPQGYSQSEIPTEVMSALTRDYSALMKKIEEKKGGWVIAKISK